METINIKDLEVKEGEIVKKERHSTKYSKDNALEEHEQTKLFNAIGELKVRAETKYRYEVLVHLMINAGLRVSEALQVRLEWFNECEKGIMIRIPQKTRDLKNMKRDWKTKTVAGNREVFFLDKGVGEKVRSYFIVNKGIMISRQRGWQIIKMLGEKIGKPELHPHALRSTYANKLVYMDVNDSTLCYYMGWNDLNTAKNYIKTSNIAARRDLIKKSKEE